MLVYAGLGVGECGCGRVWVLWIRVCKGGLVSTDRTDRMGMGDISSGSMCMQV